MRVCQFRHIRKDLTPASGAKDETVYSRSDTVLTELDNLCLSGCFRKPQQVVFTARLAHASPSLAAAEAALLGLRASPARVLTWNQAVRSAVM